MYCIRHIQNNNGIFSTLFFQVYIGIFNHIQRYSSISTNIKTLLRHIQTYSGVFNTLCNPRYSQPCHILSPGIFRTGGLFKALWSADQIYSDIFLHMQKPDILGIPEYSEPFHNYIPTYIQNPVIFTKIYECSELCHI